MSGNIPNWFIPKYNDEVQARLQQTKPMLADRVSGGGTFVGDKLYFPRIGKVETYSAKRFDPISLANVRMDMIEVHADPEFVLFGIWDPDKVKLNINVATEYARQAVNAIVRAEDRKIATALNTAAASGVGNVTDNVVEQIPTIGDYDTVADLDTLVAGIEALGSAYAFDGEDITYVSPFKMKANMSLDPYLAKNDVKGNRLWDDVTFRSWQGLNNQDGKPLEGNEGATTGVDTFLFARSAVVSAHNKEKTEINERVGISLTDLLGQWFSAGAAVREPKGVVRIKSKYNFAISRKPIPTKAV